MVVPKVLVANRGEIAIRILRSARELGWCTVALYTTEPSLDISHATYADEAAKLDDVSQYVNVSIIVDLALKNHCTHVHPGYGFLSESPALANDLAQLNPPITFIGPAVSTLRLAGDKVLSRDLVNSLGVPIAEGTRVFSSEDVRSFAALPQVNYPIMVKALDGGGGRGIRIVEDASSVDEAFKRCIGESSSGQVFAEKTLSDPGWKHIEIQVIGDGTGAVNHLWERECSVQRRFQKVVEFAPSRLPRSVIHSLITASLKIAGHLNYKGLGTFEFLVHASTLEWVFLEINPRIQVEHTITEEIMDIDLVRTQLLLFFPSSSTTLSSLLLSGPPSAPSSTAIQLRLTAENTQNGFSLSPGTISSSGLQWPAGRGVRVDTWLSSSSFQPISGWFVGTDFDSLLAKIIVRDESFEKTTRKAQRALREFSLGPNSMIKTNIDALVGVLEHPDWKNNTFDIFWLERNLEAISSLGKSVIGARSQDIVKLQATSGAQQGSNILNSGSSNTVFNGNMLLQPGSLFHLTFTPTLSFSASESSKKHFLTLKSIAHNAFPERLDGILESTLSPAPLTFSLSQSTSPITNSKGFEPADPSNPLQVATPLSGKIIEIHSTLTATEVKVRQVKKGDTLIVLSVMKMETAVLAPHDGVIERVGKGLRVGVIINEGMLVCVVMPVETSRL